MVSRQGIVSWLRSFQQDFIDALEAYEKPKHSFQSHSWQRPGGGGGESRVIQGGHIFEKAGVNFSEVHGVLPERLIQKLNLKESEFYATGVSIVIHPFSPCVPTVHANFRYFEQASRSWFGGGADLTPYTYEEGDFRQFHQALHESCEVYQAGSYKKFKKNCDEYFFLPHRDECRGVGGIFFDYISDDMDRTFNFIQETGSRLTQVYSDIVGRRKDLKFTERQKKFQLLRRGRYVEFNLVYDRGTLFGLETKGNIESILMSLPGVVHFDYRPELESTDEEKKLMSVFRQPKNWI